MKTAVSTKRMRSAYTTDTKTAPPPPRAPDSAPHWKTILPPPRNRSKNAHVAMLMWRQPRLFRSDESSTGTVPHSRRTSKVSPAAESSVRFSSSLRRPLRRQRKGHFHRPNPIRRNITHRNPYRSRAHRNIDLLLRAVHPRLAPSRGARSIRRVGLVDHAVQH